MDVSGMSTKIRKKLPYTTFVFNVSFVEIKFDYSLKLNLIIY